MKLKELAAIMKHIDICMLTTNGPRGVIESRPMSNNREVEYDGNNYFFADGDSDLVKHLKKNNQVNLAFIGHKSFLNRSDIYISVIGKAKTTENKAAIKKHWVKDLELWFKKGIETKGLTLIHVKANSLKYWDNYKEYEVKVQLSVVFDAATAR